MSEPSHHSAKTCFVISPIGEEGSEDRKHSDQVLRHIIRPATEAMGYISIRADEIDKPGLITSQVIQHVVNDDLVVADLTGANPNVFYELAIRHTIRKPFIQLIQRGEKIPFDIAQQRTIQFDRKDLDSVAAARAAIESQISEIEANPESAENPIGTSLELQKLKLSENPQDREIALILEEVTTLRRLLQSANEGSMASINSESIERFVFSGARRAFMSPQADRRILKDSSLHNFGMKLSDRTLQLYVAADLIANDLPWVAEYIHGFAISHGGDDVATYRGIRNSIEALQAITGEKSQEFSKISDLVEKRIAAAISILENAEPIPF